MGILEHTRGEAAKDPVDERALVDPGMAQGEGPSVSIPDGIKLRRLENFWIQVESMSEIVATPSVFAEPLRRDESPGLATNSRPLRGAGTSRHSS